jgi:enoyl-CoA hydratase/carnithine racemase
VILDEIDFRRAGEGVAEIVLNRPGTLNAISGRSGGMRDQLLHAVGMAEDDAEIGCVVLRGAGRAFSGGGDIVGNEQREGPADHERFLRSAGEFHERIRTSAVPMIAAVHGYCLGAGLTLAASCDLIVAGEGTRFGFPEGRIGLAGASAVVPIVGRQWAKFLMITGELLTASRARELGLVLSVERDEEVSERALDLAARIARMPREAVLLNRRAIDATADAGGDTAARLAALAADTLTTSAAPHATAPDGRTFRSIIETEGMAGLKAAREAQFTEPWLHD